MDIQTNPNNPLPLLNKNKWWLIGAVVALIAVGAFFYGLTQLSLKKEREKLNIVQQQYAFQKQVNTDLAKKTQEQETQFKNLQNSFNQVLAMNRNTDRSRSEITVKTTYDPATGKLIEKLVSKVGEMEKTIEENKTETHSAATTTIEITRVATSTITAATSAVEIASASSTVTVKDTSKVEVKPGGGGEKKDKRIAVGVAYHDGKIKPAVSYRAKAFGIGNIVSVGPALIVGNDVAGAGMQIDVLDLPRVGAGYGCSLKKGRKCGEIFSLGLKLDF